MATISYSSAGDVLRLVGEVSAALKSRSFALKGRGRPTRSADYAGMAAKLDTAANALAGGVKG